MLKELAVPATFLIASFAGAVPIAFAAETGKGPDGMTGAWRGRVQFTSGAFAETKDLEFMYVFNVGGTHPVEELEGYSRIERVAVSR